MKRNGGIKRSSNQPNDLPETPPFPDGDVHQIIVAHYLDEFVAGRRDDAFYNLIKENSTIIPELINTYEHTTDLDAKVFLIEVTSEFLHDSSLYFLRHALGRDEDQI